MPDTDTTDVSQGVGRTRLVSPVGDLQVLSGRQETDVRTAITRGLKEYLERLSIHLDGGRVLSFKQVFQTWAVPEVPSVIPSATVYATSPGTYDTSSFTPTRKVLADKKTVLRQPCEFVQEVFVEVWAQDPIQRMGLTMMMENGFCPYDEMYGFRLELPHYFNVRADFEPTQMAYMDSEDASQQRWRRLGFRLMARAPQTFLVGKVPLLKPRVDLVEAVQGADDNPLSLGYDPRLDPKFGRTDGPQPPFAPVDLTTLFRAGR